MFKLQKLLLEYSDLKTIAGLTSNQIQRDLRFPKLIAEAIIELAKNKK